MRHPLQVVWVCFALGASTHGVSGQTTDEPPPAASESITITVSADGLGQYTEEFSTTVLRLERLLGQLRKAELSLPAEDIQKLEALVASSTRLIEALGDNAERITTVIEEAEAPVLDMSSQVLDQAEQRVVVPIITGVDSALQKTSKTVTFAIVALTLLVLMVLTFLSVAAYLLNRRAKALFTGMGKIIDGHVVVPRDTWKAATAALNSDK